MMSKSVPVAIASLVGILMIVAYFSPVLLPWRQTAEDWYSIIAAIAMMYGGINLCIHHLKKISDREAGWGYSAVTVLAFAITVIVGLLKVGVVPESVANLDRVWSGRFQQEGGFLWWNFQYLMSPIVSTMFALLAFYVASAAFRAFRAKNVDAVLLLATALIVLIGQTKDREITSLFLPAPTDGSLPYLPIADITEFIRKTFVTSGQRAIIIGVSLGVVATSLRVILGLDRNYLGGDE
jgi:hypothetical protein